MPQLAVIGPGWGIKHSRSSFFACSDAIPYASERRQPFCCPGPKKRSGDDLNIRKRLTCGPGSRRHPFEAGRWANSYSQSQSRVAVMAYRRIAPVHMQQSRETACMHGGLAIQAFIGRACAHSSVDRAGLVGVRAAGRDRRSSI